MKNSDNTNESDEEREALVFRLLDNRLSDDEFDAVSQRLSTDEPFRRLYVRLVDLDASLYDECTAEPDAAFDMQPPKTNSHSSLLWAVASLTALACMLVLAVWNYVTEHPNRDQLNARQSADSPTASAASINSTAQNGLIGSTTSFITADGTNRPDAAVLVFVDGDARSRFVAGSRLKPGKLRLTDGYMQLEFISGAVIGLQGPAELNIESKDSATLISGQVAAYVPFRGRGFVLNAPNSAIFDLGTEFGVQVDENGQTDVEVHNGEIELSVIGDDGNTLTSERVSDQAIVRVDPKNYALTELNPSANYIPKMRPIPKPALHIPETYVQAVKDSKPIIYWRFENTAQKSVPNEVGDKWTGRLHTSGEAEGNIRMRDGQLLLSRSFSPRHVSPELALPDLNAGPFSIEFWMRPDDLTHSTIVGIYPETEQEARLHLNVIEIATETHFIHEPGALRFLHRNPPDHKSLSGRNVFTKGVCSPNQWQHVVAVKSADELLLYFNGQLVHSVPVTTPDSLVPFRILIGQLYPQRLERQFSGAIDEFAIYDRPLNAGEVERHFQLIK